MALDQDKENYGEFANVVEPELQELTDAQTAADFGLIYEHYQPGTLVRLCHPPQPDFQVRVGDHLVWFESTEADRKGRKRGEEYRNLRKVPREQRTWTHIENDAYRAEHDEFPSVLRDRVLDKAEKVLAGKYKSDAGEIVSPNLIVRDNFSHDHSVDACAAFITDWKGVFPSIWVLPQDGRIVQLWPLILELRIQGGLVNLYPEEEPEPLGDS